MGSSRVHFQEPWNPAACLIPVLAPVGSGIEDYRNAMRGEKLSDEDYLAIEGFALGGIRVKLKSSSADFQKQGSILGCTHFFHSPRSCRSNTSCPM
jgi:hypothetical protein